MKVMRIKNKSIRITKGFTFLEFIIVICIIIFLAMIALNKFIAVMVEAERVMLEHTVGTLQNIAGIVVAEQIMKGDLSKIVKLHHSNPMDLLLKAPSNYLGEFRFVDPKKIEPGHWYFNNREKTLVYRVRYEDYFRSYSKDGVSAHFRLKLIYDDHNDNRRYDANVDAIRGVRLMEAYPYHWVNSSR